jgi:glucan phosphorylase
MANEMKERVKERVTEQVETRLADTRTRAAGHVSAVAETLHSSSEDLRGRGEEKVSQYVEKAAGQVERMATYLQDADVGEVVDRVERFARREPAAFMAGAFAVGFLASRFLKSSRETGYPMDDRTLDYDSNRGW